jgi:ketosteroid isomerase-like protein
MACGRHPRRIRMRFGLIATLAAALVCGAFAQGHTRPMMKIRPMAARGGGERAMFAAMYKQAEKAFENKDADGITAGMTPDFSETAMGRTRKGKDAKDDLKQFLAIWKTIHCNFTMNSCKVSGNTAMTNDSVHLWGTGKMNPQAKKDQKIDATRNEAMTWTKVGGKWMVKSIVATNEVIKVDGKKLDFSKMGG